MASPLHDGDCSIYSSMSNGLMTDGICTCGYAARMQRNLWDVLDDWYSPERLRWGIENKYLLPDEEADKVAQDLLERMRDISKSSLPDQNKE